MTPDTGVALLNAQPVPQTARAFTVAFTQDETRVARMRRIARAFMRHWKVSSPLADDFVLTVSELVTNAVQHGFGAGQLRAWYDADELHVEVTDGNPAPAALHFAGDDDVSGRGLFLVAALVKEWGVSDDGKTTWCTFTYPGGRP
ncbi:ATP-binding protein [Streptomyces sp. NBC_01387]|uniref:ATP-binding protein n=1 Tax=unclassified Streptomyces TaxID=2593676 RepID=UPI002254B126|nr:MULTISPECIES: ATP-binding protein [unclassified Streptomyces]MCX4549611.1 ATP-binding protein [Streptomyces sp. NBC_01500]WSC21143.1 ATP-binding protein [Streptomyces sp. NBC_01766]